MNMKLHHTQCAITKRTYRLISITIAAWRLTFWTTRHFIVTSARLQRAQFISGKWCF